MKYLKKVSAGEKITASLYNDMVDYLNVIAGARPGNGMAMSLNSGGISYVQEPQTRSTGHNEIATIFNSTDQAGIGAFPATVKIDTVVVDTTGGASVGSWNYTFGVDGVYMICGAVVFKNMSLPASGTMDLGYSINGGVKLRLPVPHDGGASGANVLSGSFAIYEPVSAGDIITLVAGHGGASGDIDGTTYNSTFLSIAYKGVDYT